MRRSPTKREYLEVVGIRGGGEQCGNKEMEVLVAGGREFG